MNALTHTSNSMINRMVIVAMALLLSAGCEKEVEKIVPQTVITVESVTVLVDGVALAEDGVVDQGATVQFTASFEINEDVEDVTVGALTLTWYSEDGIFSSAIGDTVSWKAPDEDGAYVISVHATDETYIGIGSKAVGVGIYSPTAANFYIGESACSACHSGADVSGSGYNIHEKWSETGHGSAWATLQESGGAASYCEKCHTVGTPGYAIGTEDGDSGWDEAPIEKFVNVQCENCHGPGSDHANVSTGSTAIQISYDAADCGSCHDGGHHPYFTEWGGDETAGIDPSPHAFDVGSAYATGISSCQGCHEGVAAAKRFDAIEAGTNEFYGSGSIAERPDVADVPLNNISCQVCHSPHKDDNPHQLRTVADIKLVTANNESPIVTVGGTGKLCMQCHHARKSPDQHVADGNAHFGPHANPQADMLAGKSAFLGVALAGEEWPEASHLNVQNSCKTCHLNSVEYDPAAGKAVTGHSFLPTVAACANCHGSISAFDDILALSDFDNDGTIEGVQSEVTGLMATLEASLVDSFLTIGADTSAASGWDLTHALGELWVHTSETDSIAVPENWRAAGYNYVFIDNDKSKGVHNPDFAIRLLHRSYRYLTGITPPGMTAPFEKTVAWD